MRVPVSGMMFGTEDEIPVTHSWNNIQCFAEHVATAPCRPAQLDGHCRGSCL